MHSPAELFKGRFVVRTDVFGFTEVTMGVSNVPWLKKPLIDEVMQLFVNLWF